jgi:CO/xanthine dehydrogenase Mo-binding subunit
MQDEIPAVGCSAPRFDATSKVRGAEKYAADCYEPDMLWAGAKRAGIAHGRILAVDTTDAESVPGVLRVLTRKDVPGTNRQGIVHKDQPVLAGEKVRHCGEPVALVLAENRESLKQALSRIRLEVDPLPGVFDPEAALKPGAPMVHAAGNTLLSAVIQYGDVANAFSNCDIILEDCFEVPFQEHAFLETENGFAQQKPDGSLVMTVSTQAPFRDRMEIGHALGLDFSAIRIISPYLGGGFGGKDGATVQCLLALAAINADCRPVKMWWDREESFIAGYKRHAARLYYKLGAGADGTLIGLECRLYYDTGAYAHLGGEVLELGMEHAGGPYRIPHVLIQGWSAYTNNPVAGAMRGFGVSQAAFAIEQMMNLLAKKLCMDPLDLRLKNALRRGDRNSSGVTLVHSTGIVSCLKTITQHPLWLTKADWKARAGRFKRRGVGVCAVFNAMGYGRGLPDSAIAKVELTQEGRIRVYCGVSDMGQGNASAFVQIAGELLCQDTGHLELVLPDTDKTHPCGSSSAGRTTYTYGNALIRACRQLKEKLIHRASLVLFLDEPAGLVLLPGRVRHLPSDREVSFLTLSAMLPESDRTAIDQHVMTVASDGNLNASGFILGFPHILFSYAAHLAGIEIDELTGGISVLFYLAVSDAGRIINPQGVEQQVQGAVAQGLGYALYEDVLVRDGRILNPSLTDYIIPTTLDIPDITSLSIETVESTGPFGMKGVGEVGMNGPLPVVAGAVLDAVGVWSNRSPVTAERVLEALGLINGEGRKP